MILLRKGEANTITVTLTENCSLVTPDFLFCFTNELDKSLKFNIVLQDQSLFTERYNRFILSDPDDYDFKEGFWSYEVYEQIGTQTETPTTGLVEQGRMKVINETTSTDVSYEQTRTTTIYP